MAAKRRLAQMWLLSGIVITLGVACYLLWPRPTLDAQARHVTQALFDGDTDTLWDRSIEKMRGDSGLTRSTFRRLYEEMYVPILSQWKVSGEILQADTPVNATGMAQAEVTSRSGRKAQVGWVVFNDGDGFGLVRLTDLLAKAWLLEYLAAGGDTELAGYKTRAYLAALTRDIEKLRAIGLVGQTPIDPTEPVLRLDDWLAAKQADVAILDARSKP